jgi:DNA modification methylase
MKIYCGDALTVLKTLPDASVQSCVTSPPYWGLRDYGVDGQIGLESTMTEHLAKLVEVFSEVKRVLRDDGTLWVNYGDTYSGSGKGAAQYPDNAKKYKQDTSKGILGASEVLKVKSELPPKNLMGLPWRLAFALQDDGWILRSEIIWHKPNAMPESVKDRPVKAHEHLFLLAKQPKYYFDSEAIKEDAVYSPDSAERSFDRESGKMTTLEIPNQKYKQHRPRESKKRGDFNSKYREAGLQESFRAIVSKRNPRTVWAIPTQPTKEAHFATFPEELVSRCIKAGSKVGDVVLDPFLGSGTTLSVASGLGRSGIGIELNPSYVEIARKRCGMFVEIERSS